MIQCRYIIYVCIYIYIYTHVYNTQVAQMIKCLPAMQETWVQPLGPTPGSGRSPGEGNGKPLQYSCLENPMDRGAWQVTDYGIAESNTSERLHFFFNIYIYIYIYIYIVSIRYYTMSLQDLAYDIKLGKTKLLIIKKSWTVSLLFH